MVGWVVESLLYGVGYVSFSINTRCSERSPCSSKKKNKKQKKMTVPRKDLLCCWLPRSHQPSGWKYDEIVTYAHFQEFKTSLANFEKKALPSIVKRKKISSLSSPWAKGGGGPGFLSLSLPASLPYAVSFLFFLTKIRRGGDWAPWPLTETRHC